MVVARRCERDLRGNGAFAENGCDAEGVETVTSPEGEVRLMCPEHAIEGRRLNHLAYRVALGDPNAREQLAWVNAAPDRDEYNRRVATLPGADAIDTSRLRALQEGIVLPWKAQPTIVDGDEVECSTLVLCPFGDDGATDTVAEIDMGHDVECDDAHAALIVGAVNHLGPLCDEVDRLRKALAQGQGAPASAPLSYVTEQGVVRLPDFVREHIGVKGGGGVVFYTAGEARVGITNNATFLAALGAPATETGVGGACERCDALAEGAEDVRRALLDCVRIATADPCDSPEALGTGTARLVTVIRESFESLHDARDRACAERDAAVADAAQLRTAARTLLAADHACATVQNPTRERRAELALAWRGLARAAAPSAEEWAAVDAKLAAILTADEDTLDALLRAEGRDPARVVQDTRAAFDAASARVEGATQMRDRAVQAVVIAAMVAEKSGRPLPGETPAQWAARRLWGTAEVLRDLPLFDADPPPPRAASSAAWRAVPVRGELWWRREGCAKPVPCFVPMQTLGDFGAHAIDRNHWYSIAPCDGVTWARCVPPVDDAEVTALRAQLAAVTKAHDRLRWGVVANAGRRSRGRMVRWGWVRDAVGCGSTRATEMCVAAGFNPDEVVGIEDGEGEDDDAPAFGDEVSNAPTESDQQTWHVEHGPAEARVTERFLVTRRGDAWQATQPHADPGFFWGDTPFDAVAGWASLAKWTAPVAARVEGVEGHEVTP